MKQNHQKLTNLDVDQLHRHMFDEANDAQRVTIVGSDIGPVIAESISNSLKSVKWDVNVNSQPDVVGHVEYREIKVPELIREQSVQVIHVPQIIHEQVVKIVEIPKIVFETKIVEVEKVVYLPEVKIVEILKDAKQSNILLYLSIIQTIVIMVLAIFKH